MILKPNDGQQTKFLASEADIKVFGGGAGGGKSRGLLLDMARYRKVPNFGAVIFRKSFPEITMPGGLAEDSYNVFGELGGVDRKGGIEWSWPRYNSSVTFAHFQHAAKKTRLGGSQMCGIGLDEAPLFEEEIFWFLFSRNRSLCGVRPFMDLTCNPAPDTYVADLVSWWIGEDGFPIPERDGHLRWFVRDNSGDLLWENDVLDLPKEFAYDKKGRCVARSLTFIRSRLEDNPILDDGDPGYRANLMAMPLYERSLLLDGNWKVKRSRGMRFKRHWFEVIQYAPPCKEVVRYWDRASTDEVPQGAIKKGSRDADYTAGVKLGRDEDGILYVMDVQRFRGSPKKVLDALRNIATQDLSPDHTQLWCEQDPGQAGVVERYNLSKDLQEYGVRFVSPSGSKWVRSAPASAAAENGRIKIVQGPWNKMFLDELDAFVDESTISVTSGYHDDMVDAFTGAYGRFPQGIGPSIT